MELFPSTANRILTLDCVEPDGRRGFALRLVREPGEGRTACSLRLQVFDPAHLRHFHDDRLACSEERDDAGDRRVWRVEGAPWLELSSEGRPPRSLALRCAVAAHGMAQAPRGPGTHPTLIEARFEATRVLGEPDRGDAVVHGELRGTLRQPGSVLRLRGRAHFHEQGFEPQQPEQAATLVSLRGPRTSLLAFRAGDRVQARCWRAGTRVAVRSVELGAPGPERRLALCLESGERLGGRLRAADPRAPVDVSWTSATPVRTRLAREPLSGLVRDWSPSEA